MPHLLDLPEDIIIIILRYLRQREPGDVGYRPLRTHLVRFCLVSKFFVPATRRRLYASFWCDRPKETWRIRAFLRTVIANPLLASYVVSLKLNAWRAWVRDSDEWDSGYDDDRKYSPGRNRGDRGLFQKAIQHLALSDKTFWRSAVRKDVDEVYLALLLLLLPNLRNLELSLPLRFDILTKALHHATLLRPLHVPLASLQKIENVGCWFRRNVAQGDISELAPFFRLPRMKGFRAGSDLVSSKPWPQLPQHTALEYLRLGCRDLQPETLGSMLLGLVSLRVFVFEPYLLGDHILFHPQRFGSALINAAASLRDISITPQYWYHGDGTLLGSFRSFTQLKCLTTELRWLLGDARSVRLVDILPPSLERLALALCKFDSPVHYGPVVSQFKELVDTKPTVMPNQRTIGDKICKNTHRTSGFDELVDVCRRTGVTLE